MLIEPIDDLLVVLKDKVDLFFKLNHIVLAGGRYVGLLASHLIVVCEVVREWNVKLSDLLSQQVDVRHYVNDVADQHINSDIWGLPLNFYRSKRVQGFQLELFEGIPSPFKLLLSRLQLIQFLNDNIWEEAIDSEVTVAWGFVSNVLPDTRRKQHTWALNVEAKVDQRPQKVHDLRAVDGPLEGWCHGPNPVLGVTWVANKEPHYDGWYDGTCQEGKEYEPEDLL